MDLISPANTWIAKQHFNIIDSRAGRARKWDTIAPACVESCLGKINLSAGFEGNTMRIWGTILLVIGTLFVILFVFAELGGAHLGFLPFFVSFLLMFMGRRLRTSGRGILQPRPTATAGIPGTTAAAQ